MMRLKNGPEISRNSLMVGKECYPPISSITKGICRNIRRDNRGPFTAFHLGFLHCLTLLYFQYLDTRRPSEVTTTLYTDRSKYHASSYSAILKLTREKERCRVVYAAVDHIPIVSSSVLVHMLMFGDVDEIPLTRGSLNANFEVLLKLEEKWPALRLMVRVLSFHLRIFLT